MYTILVTDEHELMTTQRERIMQRSKLIDKLHFLVAPQYDDLDMSATTVCLEYITPISKEYHTELLTPSDVLYKDHLEYLLPFDTKLTREFGDLELQLTFTCVKMDVNGNVSQYVRKTSPTTIKIIAISDWSIQVPDDALTVVDQRLIKLDMIQQQQIDINMALADSIPDDLMVKEGKVYLSQNGQVMPNTIGADVLVPRTPDNDDGANDGLIELDHFVADDEPETDEPDDEYGNFTEL